MLQLEAGSILCRRIVQTFDGYVQHNEIIVAQAKTVIRRDEEPTPLSVQWAALTERRLAVCHCCVQTTSGLLPAAPACASRSAEWSCTPSATSVRILVAVNAKPTLGLWSVESAALSFPPSDHSPPQNPARVSASKFGCLIPRVNRHCAGGLGSLPLVLVCDVGQS